MREQTGRQEKNRKPEPCGSAGSDALLVRQARTGDRCAFETLISRYRNVVCGVAYHYLNHFEDAQDVAQETFVTAFLRLNDLRDADRFGPWLRRAAMNLCADRLRQRGFRLLSLSSLSDDAPASPGLGLQDNVTVAGPDADALATRLIVREALARLSDKIRLVVTLHYLSGYSHDEIARFLEIPVNTVRSRLQIAKRQLREEMKMVNDVLQSASPGASFDADVMARIESAMQQGEQALKQWRKGDAVHYYDEALNALDSLPGGNGANEKRREQLRMKALWQKGTATDAFHADYRAIPLFEGSLAIARELGDKQDIAEKLRTLSQTYYNTNQAEYAHKIVPTLREALALYEEIGEVRGQGTCHQALGDTLLHHDPAGAKTEYARALELYEQAGAKREIAYCRAFFDLIGEAGTERMTGDLARFSGFDVIEKRSDGTLTHMVEACNISVVIHDGSDFGPKNPLAIQRVFWQIGSLHPFLKAGVGVGELWAGTGESHSQQPLSITATVQSDSASVTVPAGTFTDCLLIEYITTESALPDNAPEEKKRANREEFVGTRQAWFAPNVGLVQLRVEQAAGDSATIQLHSYELPSGAQANNADGANGTERDWLPLAAGARWIYGWADLAPEYAARESYLVMGPDTERENAWLLSHYAYGYRR